jgi:transposase
MEKQRRQYSAEFREEALRLWMSSGKSAAEVEQDLGITAGLLSKWKVRQQHRAEPASIETDVNLEAEVRRLRRENAILREERDILKKVVGLFSKDGQ